MRDASVCKILTRGAALVLLSCMVTTAGAMDSFRINASPHGHHLYPAVAADDQGGFVVAWTYRVPEGAQPLNGIRLRRIAPDGSAPDEETRIDLLPGDLARRPNLAVSADGRRYVVVWKGGSGHEENRRRIWARVFVVGDANPRPEFQVTDHKNLQWRYGIDADWYGGPRVSMAPDGSFVVVWRADGGRSCDRFNVMARRFSPDGRPLGPEFQVNGESRGSQLNPDVGHDTHGRFIVIWHDGHHLGTDEEVSRIGARFFTAEGQPDGSEFVLETGEAQALRPVDLDVGTMGQFVVAWTSDAGVGPHVSARLYTADGWPDGPIVDAGLVVEPNDIPTISLIPGGGFVVARTTKDPQHDAGPNIKAFFFDNTGSPLGADIAVSPTTCKRRTRPAIAVSPTGLALAVWQTSRDTGVEGRRFPVTQPETTLPTPGLGPTLADITNDLVATLENQRNPTQQARAASSLRCLLHEANHVASHVAACVAEDPTASVRASCAATLPAIALEPQMAVPPLIRALVSDSDSGVRGTAIRVLGDIGPDATQAVPALVTFYEENDGLSADMAAKSLAQIGATGALPMILERVQDEEGKNLTTDLAYAIAKLRSDHQGYRLIQSFFQHRMKTIEGQRDWDTHLRDENSRELLQSCLSHVITSYISDPVLQKRIHTSAMNRLNQGQKERPLPGENSLDVEWSIWIDKALDHCTPRFVEPEPHEVCSRITGTAEILVELDDSSYEARQMLARLVDLNHGKECQRAVVEILQTSWPLEANVAKPMRKNLK